MTNPIVIDLSHWNPTPNWKQLVDNGTLGVIHKATEGTGYVDSTYGARFNEAIAEGLLWASYHFLKHGNVAKQMQWYVDRAGIAHGARAIIDYEDAACTLSDLEEAVEWLFDFGCEVTVYGSSHLVESIGGAANPLLSRTSLWQARYSSSEPKVPPPWLYWSLWQYTDKAKVVGVSAPVDGNKWNGKPEALVAWFNGEPVPTPKPEPTPEVATVTLDITVPDGIDIAISVNGRIVT